MLIKDPELECSLCFKRKREESETPRCQTEQGCPIQKLANSMIIRKLVFGFLDYKRLQKAKAPVSFLNDVLVHSGIKELGYPALLAMEQVWNDAREKIQEEEREKQKLEAETNAVKKKIKSGKL